MTRVRGLVCLALLIACRPSGRRDARDYERMRRQQRYNPFDSSGFFVNGATMQAPPPHTIPTSVTSLRPLVKPATFYTGAADSVDATSMPLVVDSATLARGKAQYSISCVPCHGAGGFGGGIMAPNLSAKRPPSLRVPPVSTLAPGMMFKVITDGFGMMPPHGWQMPPELRWDVVAYVHRLGAIPSTSDTRADSANAAELHVIDSVRAARKSGPQVPSPVLGGRVFP